jgi:hypothetical protein
MKAKLIIAAMAIAFSSNAQTIGDNLNYIKQEKPDGVLESTSSGYVYSVDNSLHLIMYFVDYNLECITIAIRPHTSEGRQMFVRVLNDDWNMVDETTWIYLRDNGTMISCTSEYVEDVGVVFYIRESKTRM